MCRSRVSIVWKYKNKLFVNSKIPSDLISLPTVRTDLRSLVAVFEDHVSLEVRLVQYRKAAHRASLVVDVFVEMGL